MGASDLSLQWITWLGRTSADAAIIALLVVIVRYVFDRWLTPAWRHRLWWLVALRLLMPVLPASPLSLVNFDVRQFAARWAPEPTKPRPAPPVALSFIPPPADLRVRVIVEPLRRPIPLAVNNAAPLASVVTQPRLPARWPIVVMLLWLTGAAALFVRLLWSEFRFARRLRHATPLEDPAVLALVEHCRLEMRLYRAPLVLMTDAVAGPAVAGLWRSKLLLPPGLTQSLTDEELRLVLLHELAHVKYRDVAANWMLGLLQVIHWFNPVLWFAFARCRADREMARDAVVLRAGNAGHADAYGQTLLKLLDGIDRRPARRLAGGAGLLGLLPGFDMLGAVGMLHRSDHLKERIHMIRQRPVGSRFSVVGMLLLAGVGCATLTRPQTQPQARHDETKPAAATGKRSMPATQPSPEARGWLDHLAETLKPKLIRARLAALDQTLPEVKFENVPLDAALTELRERTELPLFAHWEAITLAGVDRRKPITMELHSVRVSVALQAILDYASTPQCRLGYTTDVGIVAITTEQEITARKNAQSRERVAVILDRKLPELKFDSAELGDVINFLRDIVGADILVNWGALEAGGIDRKTRVDVDLHNIRFEKALKAILDSISTPQCKITYGVEEDVITITSDGAAVQALRGGDGAAGKEAEHVDIAEFMMRATLDRKLPELKFDGKPLSEVIDFLRDVTNANLSVNWKVLEAGGVDAKTPVTARLFNVRFSQALKIILNDVSTHECKIGFEVEHNVIIITSAANLTPNVVTRVYDVRDLLVEIPDFTDGPDLRNVGTERLPIRPATQPSTKRSNGAGLDDLLRLIRSIVASESWKENGGDIGSIKELSGQLVVTQTPENHALLASLLGQLREQKSIQILVEARFISVDATFLSGLDDDLRKMIETDPDEKAEPPKSKTPTWFLDQSQVNQIMRRAQADAGSAIVTAPRITLFNGQRAYVLVATQHAYVAGFTAIQQPDRSMSYEPIVKAAESGIVFDVRGTVSADRGFVTLMLKQQLGILVGITSMPWPGRPGGSELMIQEPQMRVSELQTTVAMPNEGTLLLCMNDPGNGSPLTAQTRPATQPAKGKPRRLLVLVKPTVLLEREIPIKTLPLMNSRISG